MENAENTSRSQHSATLNLMFGAADHNSDSFSGVGAGMDSSYGASSEFGTSLNKSSSKSHSNTGSAVDEDLKHKLTQKESKVVFQLRIWVMRVLLLTGVAVSLVIYSMMVTSQLDEFHNVYDGAAHQILTALAGNRDDGTTLAARLHEISALSAAYTAEGATSHQDWPFIALPNFQQRAEKTLHSSGAIFVSSAPYVRTEERAAWETFVANSTNHAWIEEGHQVQQTRGTDNFEYGPNILKSRLIINQTVDPLHYFDFEGYPFVEEEGGPYLPTWQTNPVFYTSYVNENILQSDNVPTDQVLSVVVEEQQALLGGLWQAPSGSSESTNPNTAFFATINSIAKAKEVNHEGDPMANLYVPVFDSSTDSSRLVVAVITATLRWQEYFKNILPINVQGIVVVLDNHCDGYYTYELHGPEVSLLGPGDLHKREFDQFEHRQFLVLDPLDDGTDTGIDVSHEECIYTIHVYPSDAFYDEYINAAPIIITICVGLLFFFATSVFIAYNKVVEHRQKVILAKATTSAAIVTSLFPKNVTDRLLQEGNGGVDDNEKKKQKGDEGGQQDKLRGFLNGGSSDDQAKPLADLYPDCTVFFCDLVGFTAWSSSRDPTAVFVLLEELYKGFDTIAKKRKVFKVETIGMFVLSSSIFRFVSACSCFANQTHLLNQHCSTVRRLLHGCHWTTRTAVRSCYHHGALRLGMQIYLAQGYQDVKRYSRRRHYRP